MVDSAELLSQSESSKIQKRQKYDLTSFFSKYAHTHLNFIISLLGTLGHWMSPNALQDAVDERFPGCMKGRTMYLVPFSMGPIGGALSKNGIELTDSPYVAVSMRVMTRVSSCILDCITENNGCFIKCLHSVGCPLESGIYIYTYFDFTSFCFHNN